MTSVVVIAASVIRNPSLLRQSVLFSHPRALLIHMTRAPRILPTKCVVSVDMITLYYDFFFIHLIPLFIYFYNETFITILHLIFILLSISFFGIIGNNTLEKGQKTNSGNTNNQWRKSNNLFH